MSVLLIDAGNSRIKWRWQGQTHSCGYDDFAQQIWPDAEYALLASVREVAELEQWLRSRYPHFQVVHAPCVNYPSFVHCYDKPQRLGVDRWLAMLGAAAMEPPLEPDIEQQWLVVDAGTALTVDLLQQQGDKSQHLGGYIVPGIQLAQRALFSNTERVRHYTDEAPATDFSPGTDTLGCVSAGIRCQQLALVDFLCRQHPTARLLITGGDGQWLAQAKGCRYVADLVFDGMEQLCAGSFFSWCSAT